MDNLVLCPIVEDGSSFALVYWKHFSMEKIVTRNGEEKKKLKFIDKSTNSRKLVEYLKPKLQYFVHHNLLQDGKTSSSRIALRTFQMTL